MAQESKNRISFSGRVKDELRKKDFTAYEKVINIGNVDSKDFKTRSFIRGRFLNSGSVTDPKKDYHLEFVCDDAVDADRISDGLGSFGLEPRIMDRNGHLVVYLKDAAQISDVLNLIGAVDGLMEFENVRILKEVSEKVNRRVNCETANLQRTVSAGIRQVADIELIERELGLRKIDPGLREIAEKRLEDPNASLTELAERLSEPIGKSGANHRMRKLASIADGIRKKIAEGV
ncbi:DNA-binding protein WhiA [Oribacterium sp. WCC10]|uniref:DNA-binding protein WhiA n=1 Tax=Oribacterium sp. WCC10 TaxID=1855343 RepID=UPI0008E2E197|nr:DNA-binding protein WhiA [Oribacterium sp. WCC10]SFG29257.1 hypothetical protein SAMN05216356_1054 [Oribacterium sp. WCC10]